jgi:hypothetical protein
MMTKHVDQSHIDQYLDLLNLKYAAGRAEIAQNLHVLNEKCVSVCVPVCVPVHAHGRSVALGCKSDVGVDPSSSGSKRQHFHEELDREERDRHGGDLDRLHFENYKVGTSSRGLAREGKDEDKDLGKRKDKAEERHVDSWSREGAGGRWTRIHRSARRALFTPFKVAGGPAAKTPLKRIRITRGKYLATGRTFKVIDDWTIRANSHRLLEATWIGTTDFREQSDFIDDDSDEEVEEVDKTSADLSRPAARESPSGGTAAMAKENNIEDQGPQHFELSPQKSHGSPAKSEATHPEELLTAARKASGFTDARGPPICHQHRSGWRRACGSHNTVNTCPSASLRPHEAEGECTGGHSFLHYQADSPDGGRPEGSDNDARFAAPRPLQGTGEKGVAALRLTRTPHTPQCYWLCMVAELG